MHLLLFVNLFFSRALLQGDAMKLTLNCDRKMIDKVVFDIDEFAAGYLLDNVLLHRNLRSSRAVSKGKRSSFLNSSNKEGERGLSICGADDKRNAACYATSEPIIYDHAIPTVRLLINGVGVCTGWLASPDSKLLTNEHCISSLSDVLNTDFEFMYEKDSCAGGSQTITSAIYDGTELLAYDTTWDYALVQLDGDPARIYG